MKPFQLCCAKKCYNSRSTHPNMEFFGFPKNVTLCKKWLENCGRSDLNVTKVAKSNGYYKLCSDHFEAQYFTDSTKTRLQRHFSPIPTLFVNNVKTLLRPRATSITSTEDSNCPITRKEELDPAFFAKALINMNPEMKLYQIENLCRFCMNNALQDYIELFSDSYESAEIRRICQKVIQNTVDTCDRLPQKVCRKCVTDLRTCHQLMEQFKSADSYVRAIAKYTIYVENNDGDSTKKYGSQLCEQNGNEFLKPIPKKAKVMELTNFKDVLAESDSCMKVTKESQNKSSTEGPRLHFSVTKESTALQSMPQPKLQITPRKDLFIKNTTAEEKFVTIFNKGTRSSKPSKRKTADVSLRVVDEMRQGLVMTPSLAASSIPQLTPQIELMISGINM